MSNQAQYIDRPSRWDVPFDKSMDDDKIASLMQVRPFKLMDPESFPQRTPLSEIIRNDTGLRTYNKGELVVRQGDYGNSAFFVLKGSVRAVLNPGLPQEMLGRSEPKKKSVLQSLSQLVKASPYPEARDTKRYTRDQRLQLVGDGGRARVFVQDIGAVLDAQNTVRLAAGTFFGEAVALSRMPWSTSVLVEEDDTWLLEVRWQGLRELRKYDKALREHMDQTYRERELIRHLRAIPLFEYIDDADLAKVADQTTFQSFGDYDWSTAFKRHRNNAGEGAPPMPETPIVEEGHYPNGVVFIRSGFARKSRDYGKGERTLNYLGMGDYYGLTEIAANWKNPKSATPYQYSLRAIGYAHALIIPVATMEALVLPQVPGKILESLATDPAITAKRAQDEHPLGNEQGINPDMLEFFAENRFINGTATMMINLDRCTRCDDCVRACAATHDNNPRFLRHGRVKNHIMIANACMHCTDPVCMLDCPTGAIHRSAAGGQVVVNDLTCIGCGACANNCPYEAIRLVEIRDKKGAAVYGEDGRHIEKATKCDLCVDQIGGPACQRACPHSALERVDMKDLHNVRDWLKL